MSLAPDGRPMGGGSTPPRGDLTPDEAQAIVKELNKTEGGAYTNKAHPMGARDCPMCGRITLYAASNHAVPIAADCGRDECMTKSERSPDLSRLKP